MQSELFMNSVEESKIPTNLSTLGISDEVMKKFVSSGTVKYSVNIQSKN